MNPTTSTISETKTEYKNPWEDSSLLSGPDLEEKISNFWKKRKFWVLGGIALVQLMIYIWSNYQLNHPAILPNQEGREEYSQGRFEIAEEKFIESASFGFRRERPLLNLGLNYAQLKDYEESHRILENVMQSNRFFWEAYSADGHVLFLWGKKELENPDCDIRQTEVLWKVAQKRFRYASLIAFFQIVSIQEGIQLRKSYNQMGEFIQSLPKWQEICKNPPPEKSNNPNNENNSKDNQNQDPNSDSSENPDNSKNTENPNDSDKSENPDPSSNNKPKSGEDSPDDGSDKKEKGGLPPLPIGEDPNESNKGGNQPKNGDGNPKDDPNHPNPGDGNPESGEDNIGNRDSNPGNGQPKDSDGDLESNKGEPPKTELERKREENQKNREQAMKELQVNPDEKGDLESARKRISESSNQNEYVRHKEEINLVTTPQELEDAMKNGKW